MGTKKITWTATEEATTADTATTDTTVDATTAPTLVNVPAELTAVEATRSSGATAFYSSAAADVYE